MRAAVMQNPFIEKDATREIAAPALGARVAMGILVAATILLGFYQGLFVF
jgi:hypothetical protein